MSTKSWKNHPKKLHTSWDFFSLCSPDCPKLPRTSFPYYRFFYPAISCEISGLEVSNPVSKSPLCQVRQHNLCICGPMFIFLGGFSVLLCIRSLAWVFRHAPFLFWKVSPYPQQDITVSRKCIWIHGKTYIQRLLTHHFESFNCSNTLFMTFWIFLTFKWCSKKIVRFNCFAGKIIRNLVLKRFT